MFWKWKNNRTSKNGEVVYVVNCASQLSEFHVRNIDQIQF